MSQRIPELDEPFKDLDELDFPEEDAVIDLVSVRVIVNTPTGDEFVDEGCLDEPTRVYSPWEVRMLITMTDPNRHLTEPAMQAVKAP